MVDPLDLVEREFLIQVLDNGLALYWRDCEGNLGREVYTDDETVEDCEEERSKFDRRLDEIIWGSRNRRQGCEKITRTPGGCLR